MTTQMYAKQLADIVNNHYGEEFLYFGKGDDFGKCFTIEGNEVGNWGLKEWARKILNEEEIGDLSYFYRR